MSVEAIGPRIAEIHSKIDALLGTPAPASTGGFSDAMTTAAAAPVAGAASAPVAGAAGAGGPTPFEAEITAAASRHGVDPALLKALIRQESNFNPAAQSPAGAAGLTQLMPGTARSLGVSNPLDPAQAIEGGAKYLKQMLTMFGGDERKALAGYNAGPGAVQRYGGIPPYAETQNYVTKVLGYAQEYRAQALGSTPAVAAGSPLAAAMPAAPTGGIAAGPGQYGIT